jgi:hypothetical protein
LTIAVEQLIQLGSLLAAMVAAPHSDRAAGHRSGVRQGTDAAMERLECDGPTCR